MMSLHLQAGFIYQHISKYLTKQLPTYIQPCFITKNNTFELTIQLCMGRSNKSHATNRISEPEQVT
jgi:hypothetical protein